MASMPNEILVQAVANTAIVDVLCKAIDCRFNLSNSTNNSEGVEPRCNLKQIVMYAGGRCGNYEKVEYRRKC